MILSLKPRLARAPGGLPDFILYTDAATSTLRVAALLFAGSASSPKVLSLAMSVAPKFWFNKFNQKNTIFGLELLAPLAFIWMKRKILAYKKVNPYIDNNNVLTSLVRGDSSNDFIAAMAACFWRIAEAFHIDIWLGRVPSKKTQLIYRQEKLTYLSRYWRGWNLGTYISSLH